MITTIDFETEAITNTNRHPKPVGLSILRAGQTEAQYFAWGHPSGNNSTFEEAKRQLVAIWSQQEPVLMHNARFDMGVAAEHFGLHWYDNPADVHDTMYLTFLQNPHADSLGLKESAARILNIAPEEQDNLRDYIIRLTGAGAKDWGAHISKAPGDVVAPYANGDVTRTRALYENLLLEINRLGMARAYRREQLIAPIMNYCERDGVRLDTDGLTTDLPLYEASFVSVTNWLLTKIGACEPDSGASLAQALLRSGSAKEEDFDRTPTGRVSTAKSSIDKAVKDPELRSIIHYRQQLKTLLTTFMRPWLNQVDPTGYIHPQFNQVRGIDFGTRTGRLSSSNPNFHNVPTELKASLEGHLTLPLMRRYILPDEGQVLMPFDFNGQEMRIAAHFAEGRAAEIYQKDPGADFHAVVADIIEQQSGMRLERKQVKITGFSIIYGAGSNSLAEQLGVDKVTASNIKSAYFAALPGFQELMWEVQDRGKKKLGVRTWGGRVIHSEPPKFDKGRMHSFDYKLLNYLIQGSAADQTKEAISRVGYETPTRRLLINVHDELVFSVDKSFVAENKAEIKAAMEEQPEWDVPFLTEVEIGPNWAQLAPA